MFWDRAFNWLAMVPITLRHITFLQFTSAIAKAWTVRDGTLREMDMFDERYVPALTRERLGMEGVLPPSLYIGEL